MQQATHRFGDYPRTHFGISMTRFMKEHELYLLSQMQALDAPQDTTAPQDLSTHTVHPAPPDLPDLIAYHTQIIQWVQHERLIHLMVTCLTAVLLLFSFVVVLLLDANTPSLLLLGIALVLVTAYIIHYFRLENTIQRWYTYGTDLMRRNLTREDSHETELSQAL